MKTEGTVQRMPSKERKDHQLIKVFLFIFMFNNTKKKTEDPHLIHESEFIHGFAVKFLSRSQDNAGKILL